MLHPIVCQECWTKMKQHPTKTGVWVCPECGSRYNVIDNLSGRYYTEIDEAEYQAMLDRMEVGE